MSFFQAAIGVAGLVLGMALGSQSGSHIEYADDSTGKDAHTSASEPDRLSNTPSQHDPSRSSQVDVTQRRLATTPAEEGQQSSHRTDNHVLSTPLQPQGESPSQSASSQHEERLGPLSPEQSQQTEAGPSDTHGRDHLSHPPHHHHHQHHHQHHHHHHQHHHPHREQPHEAGSGNNSQQEQLQNHVAAAGVQGSLSLILGAPRVMASTHSPSQSQTSVNVSCKAPSSKHRHVSFASDDVRLVQELVLGPSAAAAISAASIRPSGKAAGPVGGTKPHGKGAEGGGGEEVSMCLEDELEFEDHRQRVLEAYVANAKQNQQFSAIPSHPRSSLTPTTHSEIAILDAAVAASGDFRHIGGVIDETSGGLAARTSLDLDGKRKLLTSRPRRRRDSADDASDYGTESSDVDDRGNPQPRRAEVCVKDEPLKVLINDTEVDAELARRTASNGDEIEDWGGLEGARQRIREQLEFRARAKLLRERAERGERSSMPSSSQDLSRPEHTVQTEASSRSSDISGLAMTTPMPTNPSQRVTHAFSGLLPQPGYHRDLASEGRKTLDEETLQSLENQLGSTRRPTIDALAGRDSRGLVSDDASATKEEDDGDESDEEEEGEDDYFSDDSSPGKITEDSDGEDGHWYDGGLSAKHNRGRRRLTPTHRGTSVRVGAHTQDGHGKLRTFKSLPNTPKGLPPPSLVGDVHKQAGATAPAGHENLGNESTVVAKTRTTQDILDVHMGTITTTASRTMPGDEVLAADLETAGGPTVLGPTNGRQAQALTPPDAEEGTTSSSSRQHVAHSVGSGPSGVTCSSGAPITTAPPTISPTSISRAFYSGSHSSKQIILVSHYLPVTVRRIVPTVESTQSSPAPGSTGWVAEWIDKETWWCRLRPTLVEEGYRVSCVGIVSGLKFVPGRRPHYTTPLSPEQAEIESTTLYLESDRDDLADELYKIGCYPVFMKQHTFEDYRAFCADILWPLFHFSQPQYDAYAGATFDRLWQGYESANLAFARVVCEASPPDDPLVWIHNFHLFLVPTHLRNTRPRARIGLFVHTPFPSSEVLRTLPNREALIRGILAADLVGFHTSDFARHFVSSTKRVLDLHFEPLPGGSFGVELAGRTTTLQVAHVGIRREPFLEARRSSFVRERAQYWRDKFAGRHIIFSTTDQDAIKAPHLKFQAYYTLLEMYPELVDQVVLLDMFLPPATGTTQAGSIFLGSDRLTNDQADEENSELLNTSNIIDPSASRTDCPIHHPAGTALNRAYYAPAPASSSSTSGLTRSQGSEPPRCTCAQVVRALIKQEINRIKKRFGDKVIMILEKEPDDFQEKVAIFRAARVGLFLSVWDGLNLLPFEFTAAQDETNPASMVLSEFLGCVRWFKGVRQVNPFDALGTAEAIAHALKEDVTLRIANHHPRWFYVMQHPLRLWARFPAEIVHAASRDKNLNYISLGWNRRLIALNADLFELTPNIVATAAASTQPRLIIWNYDGSLSQGTSIATSSNTGSAVGGQPAPITVKPEILSCLRILTSDPLNVVFVLSSQMRRDLVQLFGSIPELGLGAEEGLFIRWPARMRRQRARDGAALSVDGWEQVFHVGDMSWRHAAIRVADEYTAYTDRARTLVKEVCVEWNYHDSDREHGRMQAVELTKYLEKIVVDSDVHVRHYDAHHILMVKPVGLGMGTVAGFLMHACLGIAPDQVAIDQQTTAGGALVRVRPATTSDTSTGRRINRRPPPPIEVPPGYASHPAVLSAPATSAPGNVALNSLSAGSLAATNLRRPLNLDQSGLPMAQSQSAVSPAGVSKHASSAITTPLPPSFLASQPFPASVAVTSNALFPLMPEVPISSIPLVALSFAESIGEMEASSTLISASTPGYEGVFNNSCTYDLNRVMPGIVHRYPPGLAHVSLIGPIPFEPFIFVLGDGRSDEEIFEHLGRYPITKRFHIQPRSLLSAAQGLGYNTLRGSATSATASSTSLAALVAQDTDGATGTRALGQMLIGGGGQGSSWSNDPNELIREKGFNQAAVILGEALPGEVGSGELSEDKLGNANPHIPPAVGPNLGMRVNPKFVPLLPKIHLSGSMQNLTTAPGQQQSLSPRPDLGSLATGQAHGALPRFASAANLTSEVRDVKTSQLREQLANVSLQVQQAAAGMNVLLKSIEKKQQQCQVPNVPGVASAQHGATAPDQAASMPRAQSVTLLNRYVETNPVTVSKSALPASAIPLGSISGNVLSVNGRTLVPLAPQHVPPTARIIPVSINQLAALPSQAQQPTDQANSGSTQNSSMVYEQLTREFLSCPKRRIDAMNTYSHISSVLTKLRSMPDRAAVVLATVGLKPSRAKCYIPEEENLLTILQALSRGASRNQTLANATAMLHPPSAPRQALQIGSSRTLAPDVAATLSRNFRKMASERRPGDAAKMFVADGAAPPLPPSAPPAELASAASLSIAPIRQSTTLTTTEAHAVVEALQQQRKLAAVTPNTSTDVCRVVTDSTGQVRVETGSLLPQGSRSSLLTLFHPPKSHSDSTEDLARPVASQTGNRDVGDEPIDDSKPAATSSALEAGKTQTSESTAEAVTSDEKDAQDISSGAKSKDSTVAVIDASSQPASSAEPSNAGPHNTDPNNAEPVPDTSSKLLNDDPASPEQSPAQDEAKVDSRDNTEAKNEATEPRTPTDEQRSKSQQQSQHPRGQANQNHGGRHHGGRKKKSRR